MTRYTMLARSQGEPYAQRAAAHLERDTHRWVFVCNMTPEAEGTVRKWLLQRLNGLYCNLQLVYTPHMRLTAQARTHIVLHDAPPPHAMARDDKALIKATGLNPHMSVCGWPFCLGDLDDTGVCDR